MDHHHFSSDTSDVQAHKSQDQSKADFRYKTVHQDEWSGYTPALNKGRNTDSSSASSGSAPSDWLSLNSQLPAPTGQPIMHPCAANHGAYPQGGRYHHAHAHSAGDGPNGMPPYAAARNKPPGSTGGQSAGDVIAKALAADYVHMVHAQRGGGGAAEGWDREASDVPGRDERRYIDQLAGGMGQRGDSSATPPPGELGLMPTLERVAADVTGVSGGEYGGGEYGGHGEAEGLMMHDMMEGGDAVVSNIVAYINSHKLAKAQPVLPHANHKRPGAPNYMGGGAGRGQPPPGAHNRMWVTPSGPRRPGEGTENEEQGILSVERVSSSGDVMLRITLLAAGFIIGPSGSSVRDIMRHTNADIKSWTETPSHKGKRPARVFTVEGDPGAVAKAVYIITAAVDRYKELCEGKYSGQCVERAQQVLGVEFSYQPPPKNIVPYAASLKGMHPALLARAAANREQAQAAAASVIEPSGHLPPHNPYADPATAAMMYQAGYMQPLPFNPYQAPSPFMQPTGHGDFSAAAAAAAAAAVAGNNGSGANPGAAGFYPMSAGFGAPVGGLPDLSTLYLGNPAAAPSPAEMYAAAAAAATSMLGANPLDSEAAYQAALAAAGIPPPGALAPPPPGGMGVAGGGYGTMGLANAIAALMASGAYGMSGLPLPLPQEEADSGLAGFGRASSAPTPSHSSPQSQAPEEQRSVSPFPEGGRRAQPLPAPAVTAGAEDSRSAMGSEGSGTVGSQELRAPNGSPPAAAPAVQEGARRGWGGSAGNGSRRNSSVYASPPVSPPQHLLPAGGALFDAASPCMAPPGGMYPPPPQVACMLPGGSGPFGGGVLPAYAGPPVMSPMMPPVMPPPPLSPMASPVKVLQGSKGVIPCVELGGCTYFPGPGSPMVPPPPPVWAMAAPLGPEGPYFSDNRYMQLDAIGHPGSGGTAARRGAYQGSPRRAWPGSSPRRGSFGGAGRGHAPGSGGRRHAGALPALYERGPAPQPPLGPPADSGYGGYSAPAAGQEDEDEEPPTPLAGRGQAAQDMAAITAAMAMPSSGAGSGSTAQPPPPLAQRSMSASSGGSLGGSLGTAEEEDEVSSEGIPPPPQQLAGGSPAGSEQSGGALDPAAVAMPTIHEDTPLAGKSPQAADAAGGGRPLHSQRSATLRLNANDPIVSPGRITIACKLKAARYSSQHGGSTGGGRLQPQSLFGGGRGGGDGGAANTGTLAGGYAEEGVGSGAGEAAGEEGGYAG